MGRKPFAFVACVALTGLACGGPATAPHDASIDGVKPDVSSPLALTISVTGCTSYDPVVPLCSGPPPLALAFAPVGSPELIEFTWTFGDGTPSTTERAPSHSYAHLGEYDVTVKGGTADKGSVNPPSPLRVKVEALATGAPCDVDEQCGSGLTCTCARGCAPAFTHGVCSAACETAGCQQGAVCAAITLAPVADGGAPAPLCLASCEDNPVRRGVHLSDFAARVAGRLGGADRPLDTRLPAAGPGGRRGCILPRRERGAERRRVRDRIVRGRRRPGRLQRQLRRWPSVPERGVVRASRRWPPAVPERLRVG